MKKHQTMILEKSLPGIPERFEQSSHAASLLCDAGYQQIGLDHFARPGDALALALAEKRLGRNFQGYTEDDADALIGFGASSIGKLPQGHVQNITATNEYMRAIEDEGFAVAKGYALSREDRMRGHLIERLMCDYAIDGRSLVDEYGDLATPLINEFRELAAQDEDGFISASGTKFAISEKGRPFVRSIAANFDTFLASGKARHSSAV